MPRQPSATTSGGIGVFVNSRGKLGTVVSSHRFKDDIRPMTEASAAIFSLNPVTFRYRQEIDPAATEQFGLIVEEVEKVNPDLVARDKDGKPYSVRYDQVNAMLLNEFLKEHATVQDLKKEIAALNVSLQQMSDQLKMPQIRAVSREPSVNTEDRAVKWCEVNCGINKSFAIARRARQHARTRVLPRRCTNLLSRFRQLIR
jgi:hypothetical protein